MKMTLSRPTWVSHFDYSVSEEINGVIQGSWSAAATAFAAQYSASLATNGRLPLGIQPYLNREITRMLESAGWDSSHQRFSKNGYWLRITFRHQMSLGADILDAIKVLSKGYAEHAIIAAAPNKFLKLVTPRDYKALVSFEKLEREFRDLEGVIDAPIVIGCLEPDTKLQPATAGIIFGRST